MPELKNQITTGNLWTIGAALVAIVLSYAAVQAQSATTAELVQDHEARIRTMESRMMDQLGRIETELQYIKRALK